MDALRRFQKDWLLGVSSIAEMKETLRRPIRPYMSFLPWPAVEQEHNSHALRAYRLDPPMRPRAMTLVYRLHTGRQAIGDFIRAAAKLQGPRNFDPTVRGRNSQ